MYKHPKMSELSDCGKQRCILLIRICALLLNIFALAASMFFIQSSTFLIINISILGLLVLVDTLAIIGYQVRFPLVLVGTYIFEVPSILALGALGVISLRESQDDDNDMKTFVINGVYMILLGILGYICMH